MDYKFIVDGFYELDFNDMGDLVDTFVEIVKFELCNSRIVSKASVVMTPTGCYIVIDGIKYEAFNF